MEALCSFPVVDGASDSTRFAITRVVEITKKIVMLMFAIQSGPLSIMTTITAI